jgi:hypothetical protein
MARSTIADAVRAPAVSPTLRSSRLTFEICQDQLLENDAIRKYCDFQERTE